MNHWFNVEAATEYGIAPAILLENIAYCVRYNEANEIHFYDGTYWARNSRKAWETLYPYFSLKQIDLALEKLLNNGLILAGHYSEDARDRTKWYALTEKGRKITNGGITFLVKKDTRELQKGEIATLQKGVLQDDLSATCYSNYSLDIINNKDNNNSIYKESAAKSRFIPPTEEDVRKYVEEKGYHINVKSFINYYESVGWKVGKNPMKNWKAAVTNWETRDKEKSPKHSSSSFETKDFFDAALRRSYRKEKE